MSNLFRYLIVRMGKRKQDELGAKEITPAERVRALHAKPELDETGHEVITPADKVRAARALPASGSAKARARFEQKSREEEAVGIPSEPVAAHVRPPTAPPVPAHSVDEPPTPMWESVSKELSADKLIVIRGFVLVVGVLIIVQALVSGTVRETGGMGRIVSFEESPITFLFGLAFAFVMVGWSISPLLRAVMSKISRNRG